MKWTIRVAVATLLVGAFSAASADEYSFVVSNASSGTIKKLLVSEDGVTWRPFNIGNGIASGAKGTLVWDESTNDSGCEWSVKAVYADGSESEPADFDFCEADLEMEFTD